MFRKVSVVKGGCSLTRNVVKLRLPKYDRDWHLIIIINIGSEYLQKKPTDYCKYSQTFDFEIFKFGFGIEQQGH